ncbi:glutathione S-transferase 2-like isoform X2 [Rutidosis leptorrhynchoides]|uniref:glutathione S-transferase 2-like isoform X2 n=1 Tax=Rutidosis leptorrhynchoides TaxID=125765 RepID=UPI003A99DE30
MTANGLQLYSFFMSSSAHTVRIALNLKGLDYEYKSINLYRSEQYRPEYLKINPIGYVPALKDGDLVLADSFAIAMYLEEKYPQCPLLPQDLKKKALNYQVVNVITSSTQPLVRLPITGFIERNLGHDEMISWAHKHYGKGFEALEILLKDHAGKYATGDEISMADIFLDPIITLSQRYKVDMNKYPLLSRLSNEYENVSAFVDAMPENQPDYFCDGTS